jgi:hypothetical protein
VYNISCFLIQEGADSVKIVFTFVLLVGFASVAPGGSMLQDTEDVNAVKKAVAEMTERQLKYDANAVDKLLDDAFLYVSTDGSVISRTDFLKLTDRDKNPLDVLEVTDLDS